MTPESGHRVIRVFISSTFRDMREEREELVKRVFPALRKLCESRGVTWGEVDLRWGITDEQKAEGKVLPLCLAEIKNCRPYFIGILGERYGWIPQAIPPDLIESESWLSEHKERSVTELEILHGVLNNPEMAGHAFFYFRDPGYRPTDSKSPIGDYVELPEADEFAALGEAEAVVRAKARRHKLAELKEKIRLAYPDGKISRPPRENYPDPKTLGEWIQSDLEKLINGLFPEGSQPDPLDREAQEHAAFRRSRAGVYVERKELFAALDAHAAGEGPPLVVLGESGGGKSALLANWVARQMADITPPLILDHYIGATPASTDWENMVRRILGELNRHFDLKLEIPDKPDALRMAFANGLYRAAASGRIILVLDGLNQLEDRDQAPDLPWLPPELPQKVRLVLSTLTGRSWEALKERLWPTLEVNPLSIPERLDLIPHYLMQYGKALNPVRSQRLAKAAQAANPLYLRVLLEELRQWGDHDTLDDRIDHYLEASGPRELYEKVLERWEGDYERDRPNLVRDTMTLLWAARRGLSEVELLEVLGTPGAPLPRAYFTPLHLAADAALVNRSGLLNFAHDYLRQAVERLYAATLESQKALHARIADYFGRQPLGLRQVDELPWQLVRAENWKVLYQRLAEPTFFAAAWEGNQFEVKTYWAQVETSSPWRMTEAYTAAIQGTGSGEFEWNVGMLLANTGHPEEAMTIRGRLVEKYRKSGDFINLQASLGNQAVIVRARGQLDEAMALHKEEERICRQLGNLDSLQRSLGNQALIVQDRGQLDEAMALHKEQERICRQLGNLHGLQGSLGNQAGILQDRGEFDDAMALLKEAEHICRQLGNLDGLQACLSNQAVILQDRGQLDDAMTLRKEAERICRQLGNLDGLSITLGNQAGIHYSRGQLDEAMALYKEQERICRQLGNRHRLQSNLGNQAVIHYSRGQLDKAMDLLKEQERICRQLGNLDSLSKSLGSLAGILKDRGQVEEAIALYKEEERICRQIGNPIGLAISLANQASILSKQGHPKEAFCLLEEALRVAQKHGLVAFVQQILPIVDRLRGSA